MRLFDTNLTKSNLIGTFNAI